MRNRPYVFMGWLSCRAATLARILRTHSTASTAMTRATPRTPTPTPRLPGPVTPFDFKRRQSCSGSLGVKPSTLDPAQTQQSDRCAHSPGTKKPMFCHTSLKHGRD